MKTYKKFFALLLVLVFSLICVGLAKYNKESNVEVSEAAESILINQQNDEEIWVVPSGEPIGIYVKSQGVMVIGVGEIKLNDGTIYSPCTDIIDAGDYILSVEGEIIDDKVELTEMVNQCAGKEIDVTVQKKGAGENGDIIIETVSISPVKNDKGDYMLGLWVKDDISGIGTLTYYDENGFGALGHSINDNDTGELFEISDGAIYEASLINIIKPHRKLPGRLEGMIDYSSDNMIGRVETNSNYGINGYITNVGRKKLSYEDYMPVGDKSDINKGEAYILSSISGEPEYYSVEITDLSYDSTDKKKEIQLRITDLRLINLTSGIVQGMSGTPIIQNGKLVGAVTHVLVNDPTKGYGIFIESMINKGK